MNKKQNNVIPVVLSTIAICLAIVSMLMHYTRTSQDANSGDYQYVLYLGTNDRETNEPVFTEDEAKERAKEILIDRFGGYTIQEANGGWVDDTGMAFQEYTLVIYLSDTTEEAVHAACDVLQDEFHQSSVLIQKNRTETEFYSKAE